MIDFLVCLGHIAIAIVVNSAFLWILYRMAPDDDSVEFVSFFSGQAALVVILLIRSLFR